MAFYYPEGPLGPVCDVIIDEVFLVDTAIVDEGDGLVDTYPVIDWSSVEGVIGDDLSAIRTRRCRQRVLADGSIEYYDCQDELQSPVGATPSYPLVAPIYDWPIKSTTPFGLDDDFEGLTLGPEACSPHDPDINIFPTRFFNPDGSFIDKTLVERSTPVTFNVNSGVESFSEYVTTSFSESGGNVSLNVGGSGSAVIGLKLEWDDNPNTAGVALGSVTISGISLVQTPGEERGTQNVTLGLTGGTSYPVTISGNSGGYSVSANSICFYDNDGNDCNATLSISSSTLETPSANDAGYWSEEGNTYAVWVNPEVCTLPNQQQNVTYLIPIPATDTYTIVGGADDNFNVFLNDSSTPIIGGPGGIFAGGTYNTPYSAQTTLTAGTLKMVVQCTNSDAGFQDGDGNPTGLAYSWGRNPGGWYVKICRGTGCTQPTDINWVKSGPSPSWGSFLNTYAVYPSNTDTLGGTIHSATYNIIVPSAGDYVLEYSVDDNGTWGLDGTQLVSSGNNQGTSGTYTITNLSAGNHTIDVTVQNNSGTDWGSNPAGNGWTLTSSSTGDIIATSLDLKSSGGGNLIWHTRMATGYKYVEI